MVILMNRFQIYGSGRKYKNVKCEYNGLKFDSLKERNYYMYLEQLQKNGKIHDLRCQVKFELQPAFTFKGKRIRAVTYVADFTYYTPDGQFHIVDTKGVKTDIYKLKKKMMQYQGNDIEEV